MWPKGPFNRSRRPSVNPTSAEKTSGNWAISANLGQTAKHTKDLPALPNQPTPAVHGLSANPRPAPREVKRYKRYSDVSPASSPEIEPQDRKSSSSFCVSPLDDDDESLYQRRGSRGSEVSAMAPAPQSQATDITAPPPSSLPFAPRTVQFTAKNREYSEHNKQPTRWDDYSGEPTQSQVGKTGQVAPRNTSFHKPSNSHASHFLHWGREQLQPKKKLAQARSRISSFSKGDSPTLNEPAGRAPSRALPLTEHSSNQFHRRDASPQPTSIGFMPTVVTTITAGESKPLPERPAAAHTYQSAVRDQSEAQFDTSITSVMQPAQPPSRFGPPDPIMTAEDAQGGADHSLHGSFALGSKSTDDLTSSIMSRSRPVPISTPVSKKPIRKPTPLEASQEQEPASETQPPPEDIPKDPVSRIQALETRRDELGKRRFNLETVIKELTRVIQPGSIAYDLAAKAEVKKTVQSIENEIAEIKREEHELGMKVTRAWRRLDEKENNGDGSNLWVKRVTS
ncbi:hypothetical protein N7462_006464 [Penicillium macrosclerotiorum]|uniref:uncharacterized protein n=1 Tax=Penicillium macrosclerotiorum TaxID=303699 RepID=UPI0025493C54|nr:uncharacterized protein N7462_006464 [Penicillium macrosclerotiorum]KAJ5683299.1 hypothetical protein N7462_006464 [Penicillium macrosclerotiorum]